MAKTNILLVDDDSSVREALGQALCNERFHVVSAANGPEALRKFGENQIDIALLDLNLGAESGWDTFHRLSGLQPLLPIIVMSARSDSFANASASAAAAVMEKPLDMSLLFEKLQALCSQTAKEWRTGDRTKEAAPRSEKPVQHGQEPVKHPIVSRQKPSSFKLRLNKTYTWLATRVVSLIVASLVPIGWAQSATPARLLSVSASNGKAIVRWQGGTAPYQLQYRTGTNLDWQDVDGLTSVTSSTNVMTDSVVFYRVVTSLPNSSDNKPPSVPTGVAAVATACDQISVGWSPSTDVGNSGLKGYNVYRNGVFLKQVLAPTTIAYDTGLSGGTLYSYTVAAVDNARNLSARSTAASTTTPVCLDTIAPSTPSGVVATAANCNQINLAWNASTDTGGSGLKGYNIYRNGGFLKQVMAPATSTTDSGLLGSATYSYSILAFDYAINLSAQSIPVSRTTPACGSTCSYSLAPTTTSVGSGGGSGNVTVTAGAGCNWTATTSYGWIHTTSSGSGNGTVSYTVDANGSPSGRSGTISVQGQIYTVNQSGVSCSYSISPGSANHGAGAESGGLNVVATSGCTWSASTAYGWIHTTSSGNGSGIVNYTVDANTSTSGRSGTISVQGQIYTVNQSGISCSYSISPGSGNRGAGAESGSFNVTAASGCTWSASTAYGWIHTTSSGNGSGTVNYTVDANTSTSSRSGTISVQGQIYTVNQAGTTPSCTYSLSPLSASVSSAGGNGSVSVTVASGCNWNATSTASWISITSGSSGSGNGTVSYAVGANASTSSRSGTLTIADQTFSVTQSGVVSSDTSPPTSVRLLNPTVGSIVSNIMTLTGTAVDNVGVARVEFYADHLGSWVLLGTGTTAPFTVSYNTANLINGPHSFYCRAYDAAGNAALSTLNSVTVQNVTANMGEFGWVRDLGGPSGAQAVGNAVARDSQNNIFVVGNFIGTVNFGGTSLSSTPSGGKDIFIAKYSASGSLLWVKRFGATGDDIAQGVAVDSAGNIIVTGSFAGTVDFGGGLLTSTAGNVGSDIFLAKYSSSGVHIWSKHFGGGYGNNYGVSVAVDASDNVIAAGMYYLGADFGGGSLSLKGSLDIYVAKFSASGTYIWSKGFGSPNADYLKGVAVDAGGDVAVTGNNTGPIDFGGGPLRVSTTSADLFLAKLSGANGGHIWSKAIGGTGATFGNSVAFDGDRNVIVVGTFTGSANFGGGSLVAPQTPVFVVAKYSSTGGYLWAKQFGGAALGGEQATGVAVESNGNIAVIGNASGQVDFGDGRISYSSGANGNVFLAKYSSSGAYLWARRFNDSYISTGNAVATDTQGNVIGTGSFGGTMDLGTGPITKIGMTDAFLVKYGP
jgi:DNA-binding response OmpR family regulator